MYFCLSVCLSACLSHLFDMNLSSYQPENFPRGITIDRHDIHAKGQGQMSKVKVTEVMTPLSCFWTVTPVWMHIWWWNDAQSLMLLRRGALVVVFNVIHQISRSYCLKMVEFDPNCAFLDCNPSLIAQWLWNDAQCLKQHRRGALLLFEGHLSNFKVTQDKNWQFWPELSVSRAGIQFEFTHGFKIMHKA